MTGTPQLSDIEAGSIDQFEIRANTGSNSRDMGPGITDFRYYESILSNNITATCVVDETGFQAGDNGRVEASQGTVDGLPIRGGERTDIDVKDDYGNRI